MSMKLRFNLHLNEEYLLYLLIWVLRDFPTQAELFMLSIVHVVGCLGILKVVKLLLELNRLLRPGGFFVWSATPIYQKLPDDIGIWEAMKKLTEAMCWEVVSISKDEVNRVGMLYIVSLPQMSAMNRGHKMILCSQNDPPLCQNSDYPNDAWNIPLQSCMHKAPAASSEHGSQWPEQWSARVVKTPYWLLTSLVGVYGKPAPEDFVADNEHWKRVVN